MNNRFFAGCMFILVAAVAVSVTAAELPATGNLRAALVFHASFDKTTDADMAKGDAKIYNAEGVDRKTVNAGLTPNAALTPKGRFGGALEFKTATPEIVFYTCKFGSSFFETGNIVCIP